MATMAAAQAIAVGKQQQRIMHGGNTLSGRLGHEYAYAVLELFHRVRRQDILDQVSGIFTESPAGLPTRRG